MNKNNRIIKLLVLSLIIFGFGSIWGIKGLAETKAVEGQNDADVEFYEPTPTKPSEELPRTSDSTKKYYKVLPQTNEKMNNVYSSIGVISLLAMVVVMVKPKKVGDGDDN